MYNTVLIAIDTTPEAKQVLDAALNNEAAKNASFQVLHATELPGPGMSAYTGYDFNFDFEQIHTAAREKIAELIKGTAIKESDVQVKTGMAADLIVDMAKDIKADLIVVGSHGRHGIRLLLGSTANSVLHHAPCDVLAVRIKD
ncbi:universal stress protein [Lacimicrobium sp. SS2-24]|uniref:universal stress protein n=1 Tax=Lacimicrobium sp. SS2-24 TaxID=2005569 RepID=UPI000B4C1D18|nr:universal stress protein [Lacimicrobium sp. SS2-24]